MSIQCMYCQEMSDEIIIDGWLHNNSISFAKEQGIDVHKGTDNDQDFDDHNDDTTLAYYEYDFFWNKDLVSLITFQQSICSRRCQKGRVKEANNNKSTLLVVQCFPCICRPRRQCHEYGICCPNITEPFADFSLLIQSSSSRTINKRKAIKLRSNSLLSKNREHKGKDGGTESERALSKRTPLCLNHGKENQDTFLVIRSCPGDYGDREIKRLCEENIGPGELTREIFRRVADNVTNVIYYNIFCARCNQVEHVS